MGGQVDRLDEIELTGHVLLGSFWPEGATLLIVTVQNRNNASCKGLTC